MVEEQQRKHGGRTGPAMVEELNLEKIIFLYHYLLNFRSRFSRELKAKLKRAQITDKQHEQGNEQVSAVSEILKESKMMLDKLQIVIKS